MKPEKGQILYSGRLTMKINPEDYKGMVKNVVPEPEPEEYEGWAPECGPPFKNGHENCGAFICHAQPQPEPVGFTGMTFHHCSWWRRLLGLRCPHPKQPVVPSRYAPGREL